jgi:hypothetical protein
MFKKMFALASVTALTGLVATVASAGCSSTTTVADNGETGVVNPGKEGGPVKPPIEAGDTDTSTPAVPEEKTVGKECTSTADCKVAGSKNDNACSKGGFTDGDLLGSPVCIQPKCDQGAGGTIADLLCDDQAGLCLPTGAAGSTSGICLPFCSFDSTTVTDKCAGGNKCNIAYLGTDMMTMKASAIGFCFGACTADTDCKGTAGQKCQTEDGLCVNADKHVANYTATGTACTRTVAPAPATCNCNFVGNHADGGVSADADKGFCTHSCITGAAGTAVCNTAAAGWKCTAKLPQVDDKGAALFSAQPDDVSGTCALPCTTVGVDAACTAVGTAAGIPTLVKCKQYADGKYCDATAD